MNYILKFFLFILLLINNDYDLYSSYNLNEYSVRSAGMGDAYTALADDGAGPFYNPAGLVQLDQRELYSGYSFIYPVLDIDNVSQMHLSLSFPIKGSSALGFSYCHFGLQNLYSEEIAQITIAKKLNKIWSLFSDDMSQNMLYLGGNVKLLKRSFEVDDIMKQDPLFTGNVDGTSVTFDAGIIIGFYNRAIHKHYNIGFSVYNITQPDIGIKTEDRVPLTIRCGFFAPFKQLGIMEKISMGSPGIIFDLVYRENRFGFHFGWENSFLQEQLFFRIGSSLADFTSGIGFRYPLKNSLDFIIDYAFTLPYKIEQTGGRHLVGIKFRF